MALSRRIRVENCRRRLVQMLPFGHSFAQMTIIWRPPFLPFGKGLVSHILRHSVTSAFMSSPTRRDIRKRAARGKLNYLPRTCKSPCTLAYNFNDYGVQKLLLSHIRGRALSMSLTWAGLILCTKCLKDTLVSWFI
jgi:hypothetical protein